MKKNDRVIGEVTDLTYEGKGIVKIDGFPLFVDNALPGERVRVRALKMGKSFGFGRVEEFLSLAKNRVQDVDLDLLRTGIADLGHLAYADQVVFKEEKIIENLRKIAKKREVSLLPTIGAEPGEEIAYRNKAQIPVREVRGRLETGFFRKNSHDLVPIENFVIHHPEIDEMVSFIRDQARLLNIPAYREETRTGLLRNIMIRRGHHTGEVMVVLVVTTNHLPEIFIKSLISRFPRIKSLQLNLNQADGNVVLSDQYHLLFGQDFITDSLLDKTFKISAPSFYQINTSQAERLYRLAYDFADLRSDDVVIDAYSGIGTIGIPVADRVGQVYGMEVVASAIENAKDNAGINQVRNAHYEVGQAEKILPLWLDQGINPNLIFVDPPRKGLAESFIQASSQTGARSIVYISCNPATFARDVLRYEQTGYNLTKVRPVDLFPQTHHIELVGLLMRK